MFGFIVKWIGVFVVVCFAYSGAQAAVVATEVPSGFIVADFYITWAAIAAMVTLYFGYKLSVK